MTAARILLVEDDPGIRDSVAECLELEGYEVAAVANGADLLVVGRPVLGAPDLRAAARAFLEEMRR